MVEKQDIKIAAIEANVNSENQHNLKNNYIIFPQKVLQSARNYFSFI